MANRTPAIQKPREFTTPGGARAAAEAIDAIRIRLERMELSQDAAGTSLSALREELLKLIAQIKPTTPSEAGRPRSELLAGEALSVGDVIALVSGLAIRADTGTESHAAAVAGLVYAARPEGKVSLAADGDIVTSAAWSWADGDILYAGADGALSDDPGSDAWLRRIGIAIDSQRVLVLIGEPILLGNDPDTVFLARAGALLAVRQAISVRDEAIAGVVASRADGVIDPSMAVIGCGNSAHGIYTGAEGEAKIIAVEDGWSDEFGADGDGRVIEV